MKTHNKLHELIRSLSKTEKTYFKKYSSLHVREGEKNYIRLFDALAAQKEYDEKKLKQSLKGSPVLNYFSASQRYLYKSVLKSLRSCHSNESNTTRLLGLLQDAHCLGNKGLLGQSFKILGQAKETAVLSENIPALLYVYDRLYRGYFQQADPGKLLAWEKELYPAILELTDKIKELAEVENLVVAELGLYLKYGGSHADRDVVRRHKKLLGSRLLSPGKKYKSTEAEYRALTLKTLIHGALGDHMASYNAVHYQQQLIEGHPLFGKGDLQQRTYLKVLQNKMNACGAPGQMKELEETFEKLQSVKPANEAQQIALFSYNYVNMTGAYIWYRMAEKGIKLIPTIAEKLKRFGASLSAETIYNLQANICALYFMAGDYPGALRWIQWRGLPKDARLDTNAAVRILSVLVHYEMGNPGLAESLLYSLHRFLVKQKSFDDFHKIVFRHIKKLLYTRDNAEARQRLLLFRKELEGIEKRKDTESTVVHHWIESKLRAMGLPVR